MIPIKRTKLKNVCFPLFFKVYLYKLLTIVLKEQQQLANL
jgi:hypothetical protein